MKFLKNILMICAIGFIGLVAHQTLGRTNDDRALAENKNPFNVDSYIAEEKRKVADELAVHGFTSEVISRKQAEIMPEYLDQLKSMNAYILTTPLSPEIIALIKEVCKDFGIDYTKLTIINIDQKSGIAEAGTTDISLVINEPLFKKLSLPAQRFVLAHELQHYIYKDDSYFFAVSRLIQDSGKKELMPLLDKACYQFEMRADLLAAKKSPEYAQGQKEFCQYVLNAFGDGPGTTHPTTSLRIAMADQILATVA